MVEFKLRLAGITLEFFNPSLNYLKINGINVLNLVFLKIFIIERKIKFLFLQF